jgi:hypothetical protein
VLMACRECGGKVSTEASACPHCGHSLSSPRTLKSKNRRPVPRIAKLGGSPWVPLAIGIVVLATGGLIFLVSQRKVQDALVPKEAKKSQVPASIEARATPRAQVAREIREEPLPSEPLPPEPSQPAPRKNSPKKDREPAAFEEDRPSFRMVACADCSGTGRLKGEPAIKAAAMVTALAEVAQMESASRLLGGGPPSEEERKKILSNTLKIHESQIRLDAKMAQYRGEEFSIVCPSCRGSRWRSTAEGK